MDNTERYLFITCNSMRIKGLPLAKKFIPSDSVVYSHFLDEARRLLGNEAKDLGGDFYQGGNVIDDFGLKNYTRMLLDKEYVYLKNEAGNICRDVPHFSIVREIMRKNGRPEDDIAKVNALSLIVSAPYMRDTFKSLKRSSDKGVFKPSIYQSLTDFSCLKHPFVFDRYLIYPLTPDGYTSYIYEPVFIAPMMFLTAVAGMSIEKASKFVSESRDNGLLLSDISLRSENRYSETIYGGGVLKLSGYMKGAYSKAQLNVGIDQSVYKSIVKPEMLRFMGNTIKQINEDIAKNPDIRPEDCYINHISPRRIAVCIRSDLKIEDILPSIHSKFLRFNLEGFDLINYVLGSEY